MNLQQLRYFVAVVDAGSFTAAARVAHVAQPSLSQQIRALETELGGELLERLPRALRLTPAGDAFLSKARAAVQAADDAAALARRAIDAGPGNLCLAVSPAVPGTLIAGALATWALQHPAVVVRWHEQDSHSRVEDKARSGAGTIGLGVRPVAWEGPLVEVARDDYVLVVPASDPLARAADPIQLGALCDRTWIGIDRERHDHDTVAGAFAEAGYLPIEQYETSRPGPALRLIAAGLGIAMVPRAATVNVAAITVVELEAPPSRQLVAFSDKPWTAPALDFLAALITQSSPITTSPAETFS